MRISFHSLRRQSEHLAGRSGEESNPGTPERGLRRSTPTRRPPLQTAQEIPPGVNGAIHGAATPNQTPKVLEWQEEHQHAGTANDLTGHHQRLRASARVRIRCGQDPPSHQGDPSWSPHPEVLATPAQATVGPSQEPSPGERPSALPTPPADSPSPSSPAGSTPTGPASTEPALGPAAATMLMMHSRCDSACDHCYVYEHADTSWCGRPHPVSS